MLGKWVLQNSLVRQLWDYSIIPLLLEVVASFSPVVAFLCCNKSLHSAREKKKFLKIYISYNLLAHSTVGGHLFLRSGDFKDKHFYN